MPIPVSRFDAQSVRDEWDAAADDYTHGQSSGRDYYRYEFFGPAHIAQCGDVTGLPLLDVGCGNGYFARAMASRGARVIGVDISTRMIEHARAAESRAPLGIVYLEMDAASIGREFAPGTFRMATSCLALQDMPDVPRVLAAVRSVLQPGSRFVASIAHPCTDTPFRRWQKDERNAKQWLCIDRYFERGALQYQWAEWGGRDFVTTAVHAPLEDWFRWFLSAGFQLRGVSEPCPTTDAIAARPDLADAARVPYFLIVDLVAV